MDGKIDLEIALNADRAEIRIRDYGRGFDPGKYRAPDLDRPREGGYGIHLMKGLTDHLEHRVMEEGTLVLMTKLRRSPVGCGEVAAQGEWGRK
jgi:serine/threonine-protein kinase RsbW